MKKFPSLFFIMMLLFVSVSKAAGLSVIEKEISSYVTSSKENQLSLLEKLVNINSGTLNVAGVNKVGDILRDEFEQLGFQTVLHPEPDNMQRGYTLIATRTGHKGKRILLIGHLDTVFPEDSPFQQAVRHNDRMQGPGVIDIKGGDVVILYALKALQQAGQLEDTSITVVFTGDEEDSGKPTSISRKPLIDVAKNSDIALDFECGIGNTAIIGRRGVSMWQLKTSGKEAHSSQVFLKQSGDGAVYELTRILNAMRTQLGNEKYISINPALILGGTNVEYEKNKSGGSAFGKKNVIAKLAMATGDLRFLTPEQKLNVEKKMTAIVKQHLPGTHATITFQDGIPGMTPTASNLKLLQKYSEVSQDLGFGVVKPLDPGLRGAGDISHIAGMVQASLAGLGAEGSGAHSVNETLDISSLSKQTKRTAILIYRLTR